jgi:hypothetical protein
MVEVGIDVTINARANTLNATKQVLILFMVALSPFSSGDEDTRSSSGIEPLLRQDSVTE